MAEIYKIRTLINNLEAFLGLKCSVPICLPAGQIKLFRVPLRIGHYHISMEGDIKLRLLPL